MWAPSGEPFVKLSACPAAIRWDSPDVERRAWVKWPPMPHPRRRREEKDPAEEIPEDPEHPTMRVGACTNAGAGTVELFLNGRSLGKKSPQADGDGYRVSWTVPYEDGELRAVTDAGAEDVLLTPGEP